MGQEKWPPIGGSFCPLGVRRCETATLGDNFYIMSFWGSSIGGWLQIKVAVPSRLDCSSAKKILVKYEQHLIVENSPFVVMVLEDYMSGWFPLLVEAVEREVFSLSSVPVPIENKIIASLVHNRYQTWPKNIFSIIKNRTIYFLCNVRICVQLPQKKEQSYFVL